MGAILFLLLLLRLSPHQTCLASRHLPSPPSPISSSSLSSPCFPSLFSFGDSKADTGNQQAAFPYESRSERLPYGRTFFGHPSDRYCDGRLVIDFQAQAYGLPLLSPYIGGLGSFIHGANFAVSSSGCIDEYANSTFYLRRQLHQFQKFKGHYIRKQETDSSYLSPSEYFTDGLYVISHGENDYRTGIVDMGLTADEVKAQLVPQVVEAIYATIKALYVEGARKFQVLGIATDGCIPKLMTLVAHEEPDDLDAFGCLESVNDFVQYHNERLFKAVKLLREEFPDAHFAYGDYYGVNIHILNHAEEYGIVETHKSCCGLGGKYNYNRAVQCGQSGEVDGQNVTVYSCADPSTYIHWDGIHLTERFYELVAKALLLGHFVDQPVPLPASCTLDFSQFSSTQDEYLPQFS